MAGDGHTLTRMRFPTKPTAWPAAPPQMSVHEDRCAADPAAPLKDWVYKTPAIGFVLSGWFDYLAEGQSAFAAPGAVVFGNAGEHFNVRHHDASGNKRLVVLLKQETLDEIANDAGLDAPRFRSIAMAPGPRATRLYAAMRAIEGAGGDPDCEFELGHAALSASPPSGRRLGVSGRDRARVMIAARHIQAHYHQPCGLATLAELAGVNRYQLVHAFSALMGQSPNQHLINTRVRAAAERLRASAASITDIALDVGFNDLSHFYACFKAAFGQTPRQWRGAR